MPQITLSKSAVRKLLSDPKLYRWRPGESDGRVPILRYYRRSYKTLHDGTVIEHGDGFSLTSINLEDAEETNGIILTSVAIVDDFTILVGGEESIVSRSFTIGWSKKFTYEPLASPSE